MSPKSPKSQSVDKSLCTRIIERLQYEGLSLERIGEYMGLSRAYICMVKSGQRNLTMARLKKLEVGLRRPLPLLLMQAIEGASVPEELTSEYKILRSILKQASDKRRLDWGI